VYAMIKVLAIGNSFSQDAVEHLHAIAQAGSVEMTVGNLYIGGCPLSLHWENAQTDAKAYEFSKTGQPVRMSSIREAIEGDHWDYITLQQVSHYSGMPETYQPYLTNLFKYVKNLAPHAELLIHQTWAYEIDSTHEGFTNYKNDQSVMFKALKDTYCRFAEALGVRLIPCGEAMQLARAAAPFDYANGGRSLCRDGFHASLSSGRYLLGAVWFEVLTGKSILDNPYVPAAAGEDPEPGVKEMAVLKNSAHQAVLLYR
jgi:hypothetical protein